MKPEARLKASEKIRQYWKSHPDAHPWKRSSKFKSVPCEKLKEFLRSKNLNFVEEYEPLEDRLFSVDIAFPDIKLGVEVNGNQHYNADGTLKEYYKKRHDLIESAGWKLIELHYSLCFDFEYVEKLINLKQTPDYSEFVKKQLARKLARKRLPKDRLASNRAYWNKKNAPLFPVVRASGIDFGVLGWCAKLASLIDVEEQSASRWLKRHMPDIYAEAYRRKPPRMGLPPKIGRTRSEALQSFHDRRAAPFIALVRTSRIDFSKRGWGTKVSQLVGLSRSRGTKWLKIHAPDLYAAAFKKCSARGSNSAFRG